MTAMLLRVASLLLLLSLGAAAASAQTEEAWTQFRGPGNRGLTDATGLPTSWSTTENVQWVVDVPGLGWSSPIVWEDTVYLTTVVSQGEVETPQRGFYFGGERDTPTDVHRWLVLALDVETGETRWEREVHRGIPPGPRHLKNTYASETPVTDGESIFVSFGNVGIFCLELDGTLRWAVEVQPVATRNGWGTAASPVVYDGRLYVVNDNDDQSYLSALSAETGAELWRVERDEGSNWSTPYVWEHELGTELVTTGTDKVRAYDLDGRRALGADRVVVDHDPDARFPRSGLLYHRLRLHRRSERRPVFAIRPGASGDHHAVVDDTGRLSRAHRLVSAPVRPPTTRRRSSTAISYYTLYRPGVTSPMPRRPDRAPRSTGGSGFRPGTAFTASPWAYRDGKICSR